ncbi:MAG: hypothetical protein Fues2KO_09980 [Fuerstiella sp.]
MHTMARNATNAHISHETLYVAFRAAWLSSFRALIHEMAERDDADSGFFRHVPVLSGAAPQVQLDCLFETWRKLSDDPSDITLLDRLVLAAALEELAWLGEIEHVRRLKEITAGPMANTKIDVLWVCSKVRTLRILLPARGDESGVGTALLLADPLDEPDSPIVDQQVLGIAGRWKVEPNLPDRSEGLLTAVEREKLQTALRTQPGMLNL